MFRRLSGSLPKDPQIPHDLAALGYFINDQDQIRQIKSPDQKFQYQVNRNQRVNEVHKEAMNGMFSLAPLPIQPLLTLLIHTACVRSIVLSRLEKLNLERLPLPMHTSQDDHHTQILISRQLKQKKRIIVLFGERQNDLGIFSYRVAGNDSINQGSAIDLVAAVDKIPSLDKLGRGVIITNPGQLLWYRGEGRAVTYNEWMSLPRQSAVHSAMEMELVKCTIPGNRDYREHVQYVFKHVMRDMVHKDVQFQLIGLESTGHAMIDYLANHWKDWAERIEGICLGSPQHTAKDLISAGSNGHDFASFISKRCRAYLVSDSPRETFLTGREQYGCNCYASGEDQYQENIIISAWSSILDWFNLIQSSPSYEEVEIVVRSSDEIGDEDEERRRLNGAAIEDQ